MITSPAARRVSRFAAAAGVAAACASPGMPPGGPIDTHAPVLLSVSPDSGATNTRPREVLFRFDKVVSETPRGAQSLDQLVVVSPSDGPPRVDWHRTAISVRPRRGWRDNTAYTVTILPGLSDLRQNVVTKALRVSFSTGSVIPRNEVRGVAFDWVGQRPAAGARIEATLGADTLLRYGAAADSNGRYVLGTLPAGRFLVRAWIDVNGNRVRERSEPWDTVTVALADSARHDFYLFAHDSVGPGISAVDMIDSVTLRVRFDRPLLPARPLADSQLAVTRVRDSAAVRVVRVLESARYDSTTAAARRAHDDSVARADTTAAARLARQRADSLAGVRRNDSIAQAQIAQLRARADTVRREPPPRPERPAPPSEYVVTLADPIAEAVPMRLVIRNATGLSGSVREASTRTFTRARPPVPRDSTRVRPPAPRDSAAARSKRPPPDHR